MAFYTDSDDSNARPSFWARVLRAASQFFANLANAQNRSNIVERMQNLSDADLTKIGVRRQDIVRHVYGDIYYL
jgi:uncharacterized protein YjiS (DUF1127 family)